MWRDDKEADKVIVETRVKDTDTVVITNAYGRFRDASAARL